jgi:hypothetical protein
VSGKTSEIAVPFSGALSMFNVRTRCPGALSTPTYPEAISLVIEIEAGSGYRAYSNSKLVGSDGHIARK